MKNSIKKQMIILMIGLLLGTFLLFLLISNLFLTNYHTSKKRKTIINLYNEVNSRILDEIEVIGDGIYWYQSEELRYDFIDMCETSNVSLLIVDSNLQNVFGTIGDTEVLTRILYFDYMLGELFASKDKVILEETENYIMKKAESVDGPAGRNSYIEMYGTLDTGEFFIMRTPLESIKETSHITNEFLAIASLVGVLVSISVVWLVAKRVTDPILELVNISERMTHLDFDAKYTSGGKNEIALLGNHFNQMSENLEHTISELKTANNELQKDIEQKIQVDEMRKEFLSNVSHELKTPIALIQGYAEGLKECINDDEESRDFYCDVIMDEASKMNKMVKKLLTLNQLEFGNEKIVMERFDITSLINGVIQSADILIKQNDAQVIFKQTEPIHVWGDEFKVEEVVTNFFSNALNHVAGEKKIDIRIVRKEKVVRVSVFNTGEPIPAEDIDNIWIKFYKVDKARTREYGGSGIGLSIVKAIMESFNKECGVINYENGVEFWFELDAVV